MASGDHRFLLKPPELERIASILEVSEPDAVAKLGGRVEQALQDYGPSIENPSPLPKALHCTFDRLLESAHQMLRGLEALGPHEKGAIYRAIDLPDELKPKHQELIDPATATAMARKILATIGAARRTLPPIRRGRPREWARLHLVGRLRIVYAKSRPPIAKDGASLFEIPRRSHDPVSGSDYGRFKDFVVATLEVLEDPALLQGIDDVIRAVCKGDRKK